jgi:hypothetical protein
MCLVIICTGIQATTANAMVRSLKASAGPSTANGLFSS